MQTYANTEHHSSPAKAQNERPSPGMNRNHPSDGSISSAANGIIARTKSKTALLLITLSTRDLCVQGRYCPHPVKYWLMPLKLSVPTEFPRRFVMLICGTVTLASERRV